MEQEERDRGFGKRVDKLKTKRIIMSTKSLKKMIKLAEKGVKDLKVGEAVGMTEREMISHGAEKAVSQGGETDEKEVARLEEIIAKALLQKIKKKVETADLLVIHDNDRTLDPNRTLDYDRIEIMAAKHKISQTILPEGLVSIRVEDGDILRDSILNLLFEITRAGTEYISIKKNFKDPEEKPYYGKLCPEDIKMFKKLNKKKIKKILGKKRLSEIKNIKKLIKIESKLLDVYALGKIENDYSTGEYIDGRPYIKEDIGCFLYLSDMNDEYGFGEESTRIRIHIGNASEDDYGEEYARARECNLDSKESILPYHTVRWSELVAIEEALG